MDVRKILKELREERDRVITAITALEALNSTVATEEPSFKGSGALSRKKRVLSPEGRKRIAEAARKRWAKLKRAASKTAG